jgi:hypothetical protein
MNYIPLSRFKVRKKAKKKLTPPQSLLLLMAFTLVTLPAA